MHISFAQAPETIQKVFNEQSYDSFLNLCKDTVRGNVVKFSQDEALNEIRGHVLEVAGFDKNAKPTMFEARKAMKKSAVREAVFEIVSETIDSTLIYGFEQDPWFNQWVEYKSYALGQTNEFYVNDQTELMVSEVAASNHDIVRQRLGVGKAYSVAVKDYAVKVYAEAERLIVGAEDFTTLINKVAKAFADKISSLIYAAFASASNDLPSPTNWNLTLQASKTNRAQLTKLLNNVAIATGTTPIIFGTQVGLSQLQEFKDYNIFADSEKEDIYNLGRIAHFDQYAVAQIPQRFKDPSLSQYIYDDSKLLILPGNIDKFVKFYDEGGTDIYEVQDRDTNSDHTYSYEMVRRMGIGIVLTSVFGTVTLKES